MSAGSRGPHREAELPYDVPKSRAWALSALRAAGKAPPDPLQRAENQSARARQSGDTELGNRALRAAGKVPPHPLQRPENQSPRVQSARGQSYGTGAERNTTRKPRPSCDVGASPARKAQRATTRRGVPRAAAHDPENLVAGVQCLAVRVFGVVGIPELRFAPIRAPQAAGPFPDVAGQVFAAVGAAPPFKATGCAGVAYVRLTIRVVGNEFVTPGIDALRQRVVTQLRWTDERPC